MEQLKILNHRHRFPDTQALKEAEESGVLQNSKESADEKRVTYSICRKPEIRLSLKCDGTRAETSFHLQAKRTSPFKSAGASVQSTTGSRGLRISGSNAFRGSVKGAGYPIHSPVSPSLLLPCVTACRHISTGLYYEIRRVGCAE